MMAENIATPDRFGHTPLMLAAREGNLSEVQSLLQRNADLSAVSNKGKTALHYASANGHTAIIRLLVASGADVNIRDHEWHTPLMLAAIYGCDESVRALLEAGADPLAMTLAGNTALVYAENHDHPATLSLLRSWQRPKPHTAMA
jgi:ankyrin repeat protein